MKFDYLAQRSAVLQAKSDIEAMPKDTPGREAALASIDLFMTVTETHVRKAIALAKRRFTNESD